MSKTQILVLDEATSAVDVETDKLLQQAIKKNFGDLTVLTIAHRLNTVMESDKILVMDAGKVVEFAPPVALLGLENGHFTKLLKETGHDSFEKLKKTAVDKATFEQKGLVATDPLIDPDNIIMDSETGENVVKKDKRCEASIDNIQSIGRNNPGFVPDPVKVYVVNELATTNPNEKIEISKM